MDRNLMWRGGLAVSFACVSLFSIGCAQEVGDIDRTQPNALTKADFDPSAEFYYRQQVTDTDMQGSLIFQGLYGELKRVRWEITEDTMFACSTVPVITGERAESTYINDRECFGIVAAFPIRGHFDIQRDYNSSTGEQFNTISENSRDRPWYEREYFRVDWSTNLISYALQWGPWTYEMQPTDYGAGALTWNPNQDPGYADPFRTRLEKTDEGELDYLETTTVFNSNPDYFACSALAGGGLGQAIARCDGGRVAVTHSFSKVSDTKTFEPFQHLDNEYVLDEGDANAILVTNTFDPGAGTFVQVECNERTNARVFAETGEFPGDDCQALTFDYFARFGYFRTEYHTFDNSYGTPETSRRYLANHYQIWQTSYDENEQLIPTSERKPQPIVYYLNAEYPEDLVAAAKEVERQWNIAFLETVQIAKGYSSPDEVVAELEGLYDGDGRMFKIEENGCMPGPMVNWMDAHATDADRAMVNDMLTRDSSVTGADATLQQQLWGLSVSGKRQLCSNLELATEGREDKNARFVWEREGDLRKSFFSYVEEENVGWLGYGPSSADPLTGQILSGSAHMAGASIRLSAFAAADRIRYLNGELTVDDFSNGAHIRDYVANVQDNSKDVLSQSLSPEGKSKMASQGNADMSGVANMPRLNFDDTNSEVKIPDFMRNRSVNNIRNTAFTMSKALDRSEQADTRLVDFMNMPEVKSMMLADPKMDMTLDAIANTQAGGRPVTQEDRDLAYMQVYSPQVLHWREQERVRLLGAHSILTADEHMKAIDSLITYAGVADYFKGKSREEIAKYFLDKMFVGTQLHEVGHTIGLRHNFNSSMDALNYHNEYWEIQKAILEGTITEEEASSIPIDKVEGFLTNKNIEDDDIRYLNEAEFRLGSVMDYTGDMTGRFAGLGKYDHAAINFVYARQVQTWKPEVAATLPEFFENRFFLASYKELPELMSGLPATEDQKTRQLAGIDNILNGRQWVSIDQAVKELRDGIKDNTRKYENREFDENTMPFQSTTVPYNFCSDERRGIELGCDTWDWGSTHREIVNHYFNTYRIMQPWTRYRRGRVHNEWETIWYHQSTLLNTLFSSQRAFRYFSFYRFWDLGSYTDDLREAAIDAANFYNELLAMPEPGTYCKFDSDDDNLRWDANWQYDVKNTYLPASASFSQGECDENITLQQGAAQYYNYDITDEYNYRVNYVGTFIDKSLASQVLFLISSDNLYNEFLTDDRATNISYWTLFKDELHGLVRGLALNDYSKFGGVYNNTQGNDGVYEAPLMVDRNAFTFGVPAKQDNMARIFSPVSFNHEFNMIAYAMITNSTWQDREVDFAQYVRIGVGGREESDFNGAEIVEFTDPSTFQVYTAPQMPDGKSISVELLEWANELKDRWIEGQELVRKEQTEYDKLREAYTNDFNPNVCGIDFYELENNVALTATEKAEIEAQLQGISNPDLQALCNSLVNYKQATSVEQGRYTQLQNVIAQMQLLRWLFEVLGPGALK